MTTSPDISENLQHMGSSPNSDLLAALLSVNRSEAQRIITTTCNSQTPISCIETLIIPVLEDIGRRWERGEAALSQVYMSGRFCEEMIDKMLPPGDPRRKNQPKIAVAVLEDQHTLGKRILISVIRAAGYDIIDYGAGITVDTLVKNVIRDQIAVLLISTLMLPAAIRVKIAVSQIKEQSPDTKIIVGGAPFRLDPGLIKEVRADAMGYSASDTLEILHSLLGGADV